MTVLDSAFADWMASTLVLFLRAMPHRLSPAATVYVLEALTGAWLLVAKSLVSAVVDWGGLAGAA